MSVKINKAGRIGGVEKARALVALVASLDQEGDALTADVISQRLGISRDEAELYLDLVLLAGDEAGNSFPVYLEDDDSIALMPSAMTKGRGIKLTQSETVAVLAALKQAGVTPDDPIHQKLALSLASPLATEDSVKRLLATPASPEEAFSLAMCAHALAEGNALGFDYQGLLDSSPKRRRVVAKNLSLHESAWYLEALDLDCMGIRRFKINRMSGVALEKPPVFTQEQEQPAQEARVVTLYFSDKHYLQLLHWNELSLISETDDEVVATIPYFGGMWLPRMIAACGGSVRCDSDEINELVRNYASELLLKAPCN